jgi:hypothetical protein
MTQKKNFQLQPSPTGILMTDKQIFFCCKSALVFIQAFFVSSVNSSLFLHRKYCGYVVLAATFHFGLHYEL